jgi:hypothetical protein
MHVGMSTSEQATFSLKSRSTRLRAERASFVSSSDATSTQAEIGPPHLPDPWIRVHSGTPTVLRRRTYPRISMTTPWRIGLKLLLASVTLLAMLSFGGLLIFFFPPLAVGMWWAVRHSRRIESVGWVALAALAGAEWAWQITYPVTEGDSPSASIVAVVGGVAAATLLTLGGRYAHS